MAKPKKERKWARTVLTTNMVDALAEAVSRGMSLGTAARLAGLCTGTINRAYNLGRHRDNSDEKTNEYRPIYGYLAEKIDKAKAEHEVRMIDCIKQAAEGHKLKKVKVITDPDSRKTEMIEVQEYQDWRAAAWWLEHKMPEKYNLAKMERDEAAKGTKDEPFVIEIVRRTASLDKESEDE